MLAFWQFSADFNFELHSQITKKKKKAKVSWFFKNPSLTVFDFRAPVLLRNKALEGGFYHLSGLFLLPFCHISIDWCRLKLITLSWTQHQGKKTHLRKILEATFSMLSAMKMGPSSGGLCWIGQRNHTAMIPIIIPTPAPPLSHDKIKNKTKLSRTLQRHPDRDNERDLQSCQADQNLRRGISNWLSCAVELGKAQKGAKIKTHLLQGTNTDRVFHPPRAQESLRKKGWLVWCGSHSTRHLIDLPIRFAHREGEMILQKEFGVLLPKGGGLQTSHQKQKGGQ